MRHVASFVINHPGLFFLAALGMALLFAFDAAIPQHSFRFGLNAALTLLMLMDSPRHVLQNPQLPMVIFGWLVCVIGWLLLPVAVGIVIDAAMRRKETEEQSEGLLRLRLYQFYLELGVPAEKADEAVDYGIRALKNNIREGFKP